MKPLSKPIQAQLGMMLRTYFYEHVENAVFKSARVEALLHKADEVLAKESKSRHFKDIHALVVKWANRYAHYLCPSSSAEAAPRYAEFESALNAIVGEKTGKEIIKKATQVADAAATEILTTFGIALEKSKEK